MMYKVSRNNTQLNDDFEDKALKDFIKTDSYISDYCEKIDKYYDEIENSIEFNEKLEKSLKIWSKIETKLSKQIDSYQEVFEEIVFSNNKFTRKRGDVKGSALYLPGLIKAVVSDFTYTKIFSSKTAGGCKSYNIVLAIDISYSMSGHLKDCAIESLASFICALVRMGIENFSLLIFGKKIKIIKLQSQSWNKSVIYEFLTSLESDKENMTADADAIKTAIDIFNNSINSGPQKLFIFTDGFSSYPRKLKAILKEADSLNVDVVAIAVGFEKFFVQKYYKNYICCSLPSALHLAIRALYENEEMDLNKDDDWSNLKQLMSSNADTQPSSINDILNDFESNRVFKDLVEQLTIEKEAKLCETSGSFGKIMIDLCFCIDCTGSMGIWLNEAKIQIHTIVKNITKEVNEKYPNISLGFRYSALGYRDFNDNPKFEEFFFNENSVEFLKFIDGLKTFGGDDISEDVLGALDKVLNDVKWKDTWKSNAKFLILIADSPPHGRIFGDQYDNYPDIPNCYEQTKTLMNSMKERDIEFLMVKVNKQNLEKTEALFRKFYDCSELNKRMEIVDLHNNTVQKFTLNHFIFLLDSSGSMSGQRWIDLINVFNEFLNRRRQDQGTDNYISTITFDNHPRINNDTVLIRACNGQLPFSGGGTNFSRAIEAATPLINRTSSSVRPIMILMSDGEADNPSAYIQNLYNQYHARRGFLFYTIAFGDGAGVNLLNQMAIAGGNKNAMQAANANELLNAFESIAIDCQKALNGIVSMFAEFLGREIGQKIALDYL